MDSNRLSDDQRIRYPYAVCLIVGDRPMVAQLHTTETAATKAAATLDRAERKRGSASGYPVMALLLNSSPKELRAKAATI